MNPSKATHKLFFFVLFTLFSFRSVYAQTPKEIFTTNVPITYLGVDFSNAKLIGGAVSLNIKTMFEGINELIINESKKFDLYNALKKRPLSIDLSIVKEHNDKTDSLGFLSKNSEDFGRFKEGDIDQIISKYDFKGKTGVGLVFVIEALSKKQDKASMYVTFVDMSTNKAIYTERMEGKSGGWGQINYWSRPVFEVIEEIKKNEYKKWLKKFS